MKKYLVFSLLFAGSLILNSVGLARAGDLKVSGFADVIYTVADETGDTIPPSTALNAKESKFNVTAEVDFEKEQGDVTFRMDLDFPRNTNTSGLGTAGLTLDEIEQAKFVYSIPGGMGLTLTGGVFNSPIGYEAQDAPDRYTTSQGQLWQLVPSNFAGIMLSGNAGPASVDLIFANEWRTTQNEENSFGIHASLPLMGDMLGIDVSYLSSENTITGTTTNEGDENMVDVILSGMHKVAPDMDLNVAIEFLTDENNDGLSISANLRHNSPNFPHSVTVRWDSVDCDVPATNPATGPGERYCSDLSGLNQIGAVSTAPATGATPTTLTLAASVELAENLTTRLEYKMLDSDLTGAGSDADLFTWQWLATF